MTTNTDVCRNCQYWMRETLTLGDCQVGPTPVQTLGSYGCAEFADRDVDAAVAKCGAKP